MTRETTKTSKKPDAPVAESPAFHVDAEARALMANPTFRAMLDEARRTGPEDLISAEELAAELGITDEDRAIAREYLDTLDRLETEQDGEVTDSQARVLELVLMAARYLRGQGTLAALAEDTGIPEDEIRAAAVGLTAVGLTTATTGVATPAEAR